MKIGLLLLKVRNNKNQEPVVLWNHIAIGNTKVETQMLGFQFTRTWAECGGPIGNMTINPKINEVINGDKGNKG